jgi:hypothetical protein
MRYEGSELQTSTTLLRDHIVRYPWVFNLSTIQNYSFCNTEEYIYSEGLARLVQWSPDITEETKG